MGGEKEEIGGRKEENGAGKSFGPRTRLKDKMKRRQQKKAEKKRRCDNRMNQSCPEDKL